MGYNVGFTPTAINDLERLSPTIQERVLRKILGCLKTLTI
ncbi:type II toxin-antitoxin system RelE/ParE family toxin [Fischerella sp. JS2]